VTDEGQYKHILACREFTALLKCFNPNDKLATFRGQLEFPDHILENVCNMQSFSLYITFMERFGCS